MKVREMVKRFIKEKENMGLSETTLRQYNYLLKRFQKKFGEKDIDMLTREEIIDWIYNPPFCSNIGKKEGGVSRVNMIIILKGLFKRFNRKELLEGISPKYDAAKLEVKPVSKEWLREKILKETNLKWKMILTVLASSGLRASELLNIKIENIDFENRLFKLTKSKGKKEYEKPDYVPFSNDAKIYIMRYIKENRLEKEDFLINMKYKRLWEQFKKKYAIHPHQLRHTFCTELDNIGYTQTEIMMLARHKDPRTTRRYINPEKKLVLQKYRNKGINILENKKIINKEK